MLDRLKKLISDTRAIVGDLELLTLQLAGLVLIIIAIYKLIRGEVWP